MEFEKVTVFCLAGCITQSIVEPALPRNHLGGFRSALAMVVVLHSGNEATKNPQQARLANGPEIIPLPDIESLDYSMGFICKRRLVVESESRSTKLTTLDALCKCYGSRTPRQETVGMVSGALDLIHPGHVSLIRTAKAHIDHLVVLAMSSASLRLRGRNHLYDWPIYNTTDRVEVLTARRYVDHIVVSDELNCLGINEAFCPDYYFQIIIDRARPVVKAETDLVNQRGGRSIYLESCFRGYSSTKIIEYIRQ